MNPYYQDEFATVYHGDCFDVLPIIGSVDHVLTDVPYSSQTHEGARTGSAADNGVLVDFDSIDVGFIRRMLETTAATRWAVLTLDWQHVLPLKMSPPSGWKFIRHGAWFKPNGTPQFTGDRPSQGWEAVAVLHADVPGRMRWNGGGLPATWNHAKTSGFHPTGKPLPLLIDWVKQFTDEGDLIVDPCAGSGTTGVAAKLSGRRCVLIEIDESHCETAAGRLRVTETGRLFSKAEKPKPQSLLSDAANG